MLKKLFPFFHVNRMLPASMRSESIEIPAGREMYKQYISIAVPSVCEMVLISLISMMDTVMVSSIGTDAVAAVGSQSIFFSQAPLIYVYVTSSVVT